jgi:hypothetical protein
VVLLVLVSQHIRQSNAISDPDEQSRGQTALLSPKVPDPPFVLLHLAITPNKATIYWDGTRRTDNPLHLPRGTEDHLLRVQAPHHQPWQKIVSPAHDLTLTIALKKSIDSAKASSPSHQLLHHPPKRKTATPSQRVKNQPHRPPKAKHRQH